MSFTVRKGWKSTFLLSLHRHNGRGMGALLLVGVTEVYALHLVFTDSTHSEKGQLTITGQGWKSIDSVEAGEGRERNLLLP